MNVRGILTVLGTWFLRASILAFALLILSQAALTFDAARIFLCKAERFEGNPASIGRVVAGDQDPSPPQDPNPAPKGPGPNPVKEPLLEHDSPQPVVLDGAPSDPGWIAIRCMDMKRPMGVKVLINGVAVCDFDYGNAVVMVHHGDLVEIDSSSDSRPLRFEVIETSPNIESPPPGTIAHTDKSIEPLGNVSINPLRTR